MVAATGVDDAWLGRRVVLRRVVGVGAAGSHFADALGDLVALDSVAATVETRSGLVTVDRADITIARLVEPAPREQYALEAIAAQGWRAATVVTTADGWLARADLGWTGRANSVLPLRTLTRPLDAALAEIRAWYAARDLPVLIQIPLPAAAALDNALATRGWGYPEDVRFLVARLDRVDAALAVGDISVGAGRTVTVAERPDEAWLAAYEYRGRPVPAAARALLVRHPRVAFVGVRELSGTVIATARGALDEGYLGVTAVGVRPEYRGQGLARSMMAALADWARSQGAHRSYLQVSTDNTAARLLYSRLGYYEHHSYRYRATHSIAL